jgi:AcrR family transcriptional regulator
MAARRKRAGPRFPAQNRSQATLDAILDATVQVLVTQGFAGTTVQRIAGRAGVSVGSVYQYFASKDALVDACADRAMRRSAARLESDLPAVLSLPLAQAAPLLVRGLVANALNDEPLVRALSARGRPLERVSELEDRAVDLLHAYLQPRAVDKGETRARAAAFVVVHAVRLVIEAALRKRPEGLKPEHLTAELTRLATAYLAPWMDPDTPS